MSIEQSSIERPSLFFSVGVLGSAPWEFAKDLADSMQARLFTANGLRNLVKAEREKKGLSLTANSRQVEGRFHREASRILATGQDVVVDVNFNSADKRLRVPLSAAQIANANTVALVFVTKPHVIRDRLEHWAQSDEGPSFQNWRRQNPIGTIMSGLSTVEVPTVSEPIGNIVELDGSQPTNELITHISQQVHART